ncbi:MAG TPA: hypothetical protein VKK61_05750 [Tepidisphaeraceae bacterium]|nr:hypothetical protein [Tepidisphaeraceae bacterium]
MSESQQTRNKQANHKWSLASWTASREAGNLKPAGIAMWFKICAFHADLCLTAQQ